MKSMQVTRKLSVDLSQRIVHGKGLMEKVIWLASHMENHQIFAKALRRGLRERSNMDVVAIVKSADEAFDRIPNIDIDLALVDISLPHQSYPDLLYVMLSGHVSQYYARCSLARGYLVRDQVDEILNGIERVLQGEIYVREKVRCVNLSLQVENSL
jgi:DNA-binding NarL/FixJ family response regulator